MERWVEEEIRPGWRVCSNCGAEKPDTYEWFHLQRDEGKCRRCARLKDPRCPWAFDYHTRDQRMARSHREYNHPKLGTPSAIKGKKRQPDGTYR